MIRNTFLFVPGIGPSRERELWKNGIRHWSDLPLPIISMRPAWLTGGLEERILHVIGKVSEALEAKDFAALVRMIPSTARWRLYREFLSCCAFFDIETDGTREAVPTVASVFSQQKGVELFVDGRNLEAIVPALASHPVWVTFGGTRCDEPWLRARFPQLPRPAFHFDLCPFARTLGLKGGLKSLEERLGFGRPDHLKGLTGRDAIFLWSAWAERGDRHALKRLCEYNIYDSVQLRTLADVLFNKAIEELSSGSEPNPFEADHRPAVAVFSRARAIACAERILVSL